MNYKDALKFINKLDRSSARVFSGEEGFKRASRLLDLIGNPQERIPTIHIAGTSGKGSTATMISYLLAEANKKVGLTLSPHVYDIRERCQVNNKKISSSEFTKTLSQIIPVIELMAKDGQYVSYFETLLAIAWVHFIEQRVDYAVIETGMGGRLDATNTIQNPNKVSIITRIGLDHTDVLGKTLSKIAEQKAGIIRSDNCLIALRQSEIVNNTITKQAKDKHANLTWVQPFHKNNLGKINSQLVGSFQNENFALAQSAVKLLAKRDGWTVNSDMVQASIEKLKIPGRFEMLEKNGKIFILDGAHNSQKLKAVMTALQNKYSDQNKLGAIMAMRTNKEIPSVTSSFFIVTTNYSAAQSQDVNISQYKSSELANQIMQKNKGVRAKPLKSVKDSVNFAMNSDIKVWLITGTFFMLAEAKLLLSEY